MRISFQSATPYWLWLSPFTALIAMYKCICIHGLSLFFLLCFSVSSYAQSPEPVYSEIKSKSELFKLLAKSVLLDLEVMNSSYSNEEKLGILLNDTRPSPGFPYLAGRKNITNALRAAVNRSQLYAIKQASPDYSLSAYYSLSRRGLEVSVHCRDRSNTECYSRQYEIPLSTTKQFMNLSLEPGDARYRIALEVDSEVSSNLTNENLHAIEAALKQTFPFYGFKVLPSNQFLRDSSPFYRVQITVRTPEWTRSNGDEIDQSADISMRVFPFELPAQKVSEELAPCQVSFSKYEHKKNIYHSALVEKAAKQIVQQLDLTLSKNPF